MSSPFTSVLQLIAQATAPGDATTRYLASYIALPLIIFAIWWFLLIRPQRQQEQRHRELLDALKPGDKVITNGGIYGVVQQVGERTLKLKIADNVRIEISRNAITGRQQKPKAD